MKEEREGGCRGEGGSGGKLSTFTPRRNRNEAGTSQELESKEPKSSAGQWDFRVTQNPGEGKQERGTEL